MNAKNESGTAEAGRLVSVGAPGSRWPRWMTHLRLGGRYLVNVAYDARRFWHAAGMHRRHSRANLTARLLADAHFLEYGMALRVAQPGFGRIRALRLALDLETCLAEFGPLPEAKIALRVLQAYLAFNVASPAGLDSIKAAVARAVPRCSSAVAAGVETVTRAQIQQAAQIDFLGFVRARHSVRSFEKGPAPVEPLRRAVTVALETPSSCNRQTCRVHAWTEPSLVDAVRKLQRGNRTFGHELSAILVVTSDMGSWDAIAERNQGFVDGGLFLMTLTYALHAEGLGTCILNWSVERKEDQLFRRLIGLDDSQLVIALIGVGWMEERFSVCASQRMPVERVLVLNPPLSAVREQGKKGN